MYHIHQLRAFVFPLGRFFRTLFQEGRKGTTNTSVGSVIMPQDMFHTGRRIRSRPAMGKQTDKRSPLFTNLPLEIRKIVYNFVWAARGQYHHIYQKGYHLHHAKCVMNPADQDPDFVQLQMDRICNEPAKDGLKNSSLLMWSRRVAGHTWGHRHWRCEERLKFDYSERSEFRAPDRTDWMSLLLVCRQMYVSTTSTP
jgi:hypothetical protein